MGRVKTVTAQIDHASQGLPTPDQWIAGTADPSGERRLLLAVLEQADSCWKTTFDDFWRGVARHPDHQTALRAS